MKNYYRILGIALCLAGAVFSPISYFVIDSVPLTAVGLSSLMIGFTCVALANARPYISPEACQLMLRTGMENTASILEELGLTNRAIYLPSSMRDGQSRAMVPLNDTDNVNLTGNKIPGRLIVRYGPSPEDMAVSVSTPGSMNLDMLENIPGPNADEIENAVNYILTGVLDIAGSSVVTLEGNSLEVTVRNLRFPYEDIWYYRCMGSPIASIVAAITTEAMGKPVKITGESSEKNTGRITLEVLG